MVLLSILALITSHIANVQFALISHVFPQYCAAPLQFDSHHHHVKVEWLLEHMVQNTLTTNTSIQGHQQQNPTINTHMDIRVHFLFTFMASNISVSIVGQFTPPSNMGHIGIIM